jgi:hypothetical protein
MMDRQNSSTLERRIHFFRINIGSTENGRALAFDARPFCEHLQGLVFDEAGAYWSSGDGDYTFGLVDRADPPQRLRLVLSRRSALPHIEQDGRTTPLDLGMNEGLAEQTHMIFFPDNILGAEFNFYGPRVSRLRGYFRTKAQHLCDDILLEQLLRGDALAKLDRLRDLRLFKLGIHRAYAAAVAEADEDLGTAFQTQLRLSEAEKVEIVLRAKPRDPGSPLAARLLQIAKRLLRQPGLTEHASTFRIKAHDPDIGRKEEINLLNDQLIAHKQVVKHDERYRVVDSDSMYAAIQSAYGELREEIRTAASLVI